MKAIYLMASHGNQLKGFGDHKFLSIGHNKSWPHQEFEVGSIDSSQTHWNTCDQKPSENQLLWSKWPHGASS